MATINNTNMQFNVSPSVKVPIKRNNLFYGVCDSDFEKKVGKEYVEMDMGQTIILYQVDLEKTNNDKIYGETSINDVVFKHPVEVPCIYNIDKPELRSYEKNKNLGTYQKMGQLHIGVYESTLEELGCGIKKGDYIGVQITESHREYWVVVNDGKNNYDNAHTQFGVKPFFRNIECASVDKTEFEGK